MLNGYIKLHRQILEWEWYTDTNAKVLFFHCLLKANFEPKKWQGIDIKRGQFSTSVKHLSDELKLTIQEVRTALTKLERTGEIIKESTSKLTIITVCKYDSYQTLEEEQQQTNNKRTTNEQQQRKKDKNIRKNKEEESSLLEDEENDLDLRLDKKVPFDVVSASKTLNATYQKPYTELKSDLLNIFQIDATNEQIERAIFTFCTVGVASYDSYKKIRYYTKLCDCLKLWIPKSIKFEKEQSQKAETGEQPPEQLEGYLLKHYQQKEVDYFKKEGKFEKWQKELEENRFRLTNMAKGYKNENITPLLLFEMFYLPLSYALNGSSPTRKQEAFERLFAKQSQYNQDKGDFRQIIKQEYEKQKA